MGGQFGFKNACSRRVALKQYVAAALAIPFQLRSDSVDTDTVLLDAEHQVIDNFGASDCWSMQKVGGWSVENRNRLADLLFSEKEGIALSCWRFNIGGGINPKITNPWRTAETFETGPGQYDWSRQRNERRFLAAAKARGVPQFLAFVNSPPGRMTRNALTFCDPEGSSTNLKPGAEHEYARYLGDILEHFARNGDEVERIVFDYISPVNEPQWDWSGHSQEGNRASNDDIKGIIRAVAVELERRRLVTQIAALESGSLPDMWQIDRKATARWGTEYGNYLDAFLGDPSTNGLLGGRIGYHSYGSDLASGPLVNNRTQLGEKMKHYPSWKLWQTEYCVLVGSEGKGGNHRDLTMKTALEVARIIHLDLVLCGASAWQWWTAVSPVDYKDGLIYTDWRKPGDAETIYPARILWALGNFSRFVRPGMQRVEIAGANHDVQGLMASAFKDETNRRAVVVYVNMGDTARKVSLLFKTIAGDKKPTDITPHVTSDRSGDELKRYPQYGPETPTDIPAKSVVTLVAEFN
ncbi:MAG TPA: glycoside hydrolase [Bryobacteraceae bacterium]|nr:glycoside hydrolase [Bryobacteraceae bacterium]